MFTGLSVAAILIELWAQYVIHSSYPSLIIATSLSTLLSILQIINAWQLINTGGEGGIRTLDGAFNPILP